MKELLRSLKREMTDIECYKCGKRGHLVRKCPKKKTKEAEQMHTNIAVEEVQDLNKGENTVDQIANPSLLANIRKAKNPITVHFNNKLSHTNVEGNLGGMTMYHNPYGITNVLSLELIKGKHRVSYDSWDCDGVFKESAPLPQHIQRGH